LGSKVQSIYIKYHEIGRRHLCWTIWDGNKDNCFNYKDFKSNWDSNTNVWKQIRKYIKVKMDITETVKKLIKDRNPFNTSRNITETASKRYNISLPKNVRST
jgi:hypothetical protein